MSNNPHGLSAHRAAAERAQTEIHYFTLQAERISFDDHPPQPDHFGVTSKLEDRFAPSTEACPWLAADARLDDADFEGIFRQCLQRDDPEAALQVAESQLFKVERTCAANWYLMCRAHVAVAQAYAALGEPKIAEFFWNEAFENLDRNRESGGSDVAISRVVALLGRATCRLNQRSEEGNSLMAFEQGYADLVTVWHQYQSELADRLPDKDRLDFWRDLRRALLTVCELAPDEPNGDQAFEWLDVLRCEAATRFGESSPQHVEALMDYAEGCCSLGQRDLGLQMLTQARPLAEELRSNDLHVVEGINAKICVVLMSLQRFEEARTLAEASLARVERDAEPRRALRLNLRDLAGDAALCMGEVTEAQAYFESVLDLMPTTRYMHEMRIRLLEKLSKCAEALGDDAGSIDLRRQAIAISESIHGLGGLTTLRLRRDFARALEAKDAFSSALAVLDECERPVRVRFGEVHVEFIGLLRHRSEIYEADRNFREARLVLLQALEIAKQLPREEQAEAVEVLGDLGDLELAAGRRRQAEARHDEAMQLARTLIDISPGILAEALYARAIFLQDLERSQDALSDIGESLGLRAYHRGETEIPMNGAAKVLELEARILAEDKDFARAIDSIEAALRGYAAARPVQLEDLLRAREYRGIVHLEFLELCGDGVGDEARQAAFDAATEALDTRAEVGGGTSTTFVLLRRLNEALSSPTVECDASTRAYYRKMEEDLAAELGVELPSADEEEAEDDRDDEAFPS